MTMYFIPARPKLSRLVIDVDKDWAGKSISNIGTLSATEVNVGDLLFKYGWRLFEAPEGLYLERDGKRFRIMLEEVR